MHRRTFIQSLGAAAAAGLTTPSLTFASPAKRVDRIGLELFAVRKAMAADPERTLAAVRAIGYQDVEVLWSFANFGRTPAQVRAALDSTGLRAPSAHMSAAVMLVNWEKSLETAKLLGHQYLFVPVFTPDTEQTLDYWRAWADKFNEAGAVARKYGIWVGFHNEAEHMRKIDGQVPYDILLERMDPSVTRMQLDVGNMTIGGGDPMAYLAKYPDRYWSFHIKDVAPDRKHDTHLGTGIVDFKRLLAAIPNLNEKPIYVEDEESPDELAAARANYNYLRALEF
jgi:sugar phosphate isomerase/epimerase